MSNSSVRGLCFSDMASWLRVTLVFGQWALCLMWFIRARDGLSLFCHPDWHESAQNRVEGSGWTTGSQRISGPLCLAQIQGRVGHLQQGKQAVSPGASLDGSPQEKYLHFPDLDLAPGWQAQKWCWANTLKDGPFSLQHRYTITSFMKLKCVTRIPIH